MCQGSEDSSSANRVCASSKNKRSSPTRDLKRSWPTTRHGASARPSPFESAPAVHDGILYIGASDLRRVSAIRPEDGEVLWRTDVRGWTWGTPFVAGDRIYAGMAGGRPYFCTHIAGVAVLDRASGRLLARRPLPEVPGAHQWGIAGSVVLAGSTLVYATIEGGVYGLPVE